MADEVEKRAALAFRNCRETVGGLEFGLYLRVAVIRRVDTLTQPIPDGTIRGPVCPGWGSGILQACGACEVGSIPTPGLVIYLMDIKVPDPDRSNMFLNSEHIN